MWIIISRWSWSQPTELKIWSDYEKRRRRHDMKNKIITNFASPNKNIKSILEFWKWTARHERVMLRHKHHTRYSSVTSSIPGANAGEKNKSSFFRSQSEKSDMGFTKLICKILKNTTKKIIKKFIFYVFNMTNAQINSLLFFFFFWESIIIILVCTFVK